MGAFDNVWGTVGSGGDNAATIYAYFTNNNREDVFKADVSTIEADLTAIKGPTFDTNTDSLEAIRNQGDAAWTGSVGAGTFSYSDTVTDSVSGDPIQGADISFTLSGDSAVIGSTSTDSLGAYTLFSDAAGPYDITIYKRGYFQSTLSSVTFTEA